MTAVAAPFSWHGLFGLLLLSDASRLRVWERGEGELKRCFLGDPPQVHR